MTYTAAEDFGLRASLSFLVRKCDARDIVQILGEVISDEAYALAQRTGDYARSSELLIMARYLEKFEEFVDNFDPTEE